MYLLKDCVCIYVFLKYKLLNLKNQKLQFFFVVQRMTQTNNVCKIAIFYVLYILAMHK